MDAIQLLLLGSAVPVALEAYKAKPPGFYVLWTITTVMVLAGFFFPQLAKLSPVAGAVLVDLAANPSTWFTLLVGVFFVLRPYWTKDAVDKNPPLPSPNKDTISPAEIAAPPSDNPANVRHLSSVERDRLSTARIALQEFAREDLAEFAKNGLKTLHGAGQAIRKGQLSDYLEDIKNFLGTQTTLHDKFADLAKKYSTEFTADEIKTVPIQLQIGDLVEPIKRLIEFIETRRLDITNIDILGVPLLRAQTPLEELRNLSVRLSEDIKRRRLEA